jgi:hypothetical protein
MNDILFEVARGIAAAGADLSYAAYRNVGAGGDLGALKLYVRDQLVGDDPCDDRYLVDERVVACVAQMLLTAMSAQYEIDARMAV